MIITIASGKGGTGKTTLAVNLLESIKKKNPGKNVRLLDCDVEAPNDNIFFKGDFSDTREITENKPVWNEEKCKSCGSCKEVCRYNAIAKIGKKILIFNDLCHSCGACKYVCPNGALTEEEYPIGKVYITAETENPFFVYGELNIGETAAPSMVKAVKKYISQKAINVVDASPGTGCSVVAALEDSDVTVLVTEPTPFGLHDLKLAVELSSKLKIPTGVVINRSGDNDCLITDFLEKYGIPLLGKIPFKREYAEAYSQGKLLAGNFRELDEIFDTICEKIFALSGSSVEPYDIPLLDELTIKDNEEDYFDSNSSGSSTLSKEIMIVSGKGGTGKTTISAAFSTLSSEKGKNNTVFSDCDVDAADLHLLLKPKIIEKTDFSGGRIAKINSYACNGCGKCVGYCRFEAIDLKQDGSFKINELKCEGCGLCLLVCPHSAITDEEEINGQYYLSRTEFGPMIHARLGIAEENSGKLVAKVRSKAAEVIERVSGELTIGDGPPGVGCPVIASISGADFILVITEPTMSGMHDMKRVLELAKHFKIHAKIIVNKYDLNQKMTEKIKIMAKSFNSEVLAEIPFDRNINDALISGETIIEYGKGKALKEIKKAWKNVLKSIY